MTKLELIELVALAIVVIGLTLYYLVLAIKNGWIKKVAKTMNEAIKYAELNIYGGQEKQDYVLKEIEKKCEELGIPFTFIRKLAVKVIKKIISDYNVIKK